MYSARVVTSASTGLRTLWFSTTLILSCFLLADAADRSPGVNTPVSVLEVDIAAIPTADRKLGRLVLVTLRNRSGEDAVRSIHVELFGGRQLMGEALVDELKPRQSTHRTFSLSAAARASHLVASYAWDGHSHSFARAIVESASSPTHAFPSAPVLGLIGVIIGGLIGAASGAGAQWLQHRLTSRREAANAHRQILTTFWAAYAPAYLEFFANWNDLPDAATLNGAFAALRTNALVPAEIVAVYEKTRAILGDDAASEAAKTVACGSLHRAVDTYLSSLDPRSV